MITTTPSPTTPQVSKPTKEQIEKARAARIEMQEIMAMKIQMGVASYGY